MSSALAVTTHGDGSPAIFRLRNQNSNERDIAFVTNYYWEENYKKSSQLNRLGGIFNR